MSRKVKFLSIFCLLLALAGAATYAYADNYTWSQQNTLDSSLWSAVTSSNDGSRMYAVRKGGYLYSYDVNAGGWGVHSELSAREWTDISTSNDGNTVIATIQGSADIYTSYNAGGNWDIRNVALRDWKAVAVSQDGSRVAAVADSSNIFTSSNSGQNWSEVNSGSRNWTDVDISNNGDFIIATAISSNMYRSTDSGSTWSAVGGAPNTNWAAVDMSENGQYMIAAPAGGLLYLSSDFGSTWFPLENSGGRNWTDVAISDDGRRIIGTVDSAFMATSIDGGNTWVNENAPGESNRWSGVAATANGSKFLAGTSNGYLWIASIETTPPVINMISSDVSNGTYKLGDNIDIDVYFSEAVTATGVVVVTVETGDNDRACAFNITNSAVGTCTYTVQAGDAASDLDVASVSGTIEDQAGNQMTDFMLGASLAMNKDIAVDGSRPSIPSITSNTVNGTYGVDDMIEIRTNFSEPVTSTGPVTVTLETGAVDRSCQFTANSESVGVCTYNVQQGDVSSDLNVASISGTITDNNGNAMNYFVPDSNLADNEDFVIDGTYPEVASASSDKANGTYKAGEVIDIIIVFSEPVTSSGSLTVNLETGAVDRSCTFSISNAATGTCNYVVQAGDTTSDLTVKSVAGIAADAAGNARTSFTPLTNLDANKDIAIDTTAPVTSGAPDMTAGTDSGSSSTDNVTNDNTPTFTGACTTGNTVTLFDDGVATGSTFACASGAFTITSGALASGSNAITFKETDSVGNVSAASTALSVTIDTIAPSVSISSPADGSTVSAFTPSVSWGNSTVCEYRFGAASYATVNCANNGSDIPTPAEGANTLDVRGTDAAGNVATASSAFTYAVPSSDPEPEEDEDDEDEPQSRSGQRRVHRSSSSSSSNSSSNASSAPDTGCLPGYAFSIQTGKQCSSATGLLPAAAAFLRDLTIGSQGEDVRALQVYLNTHGYPLAPAGLGSSGFETDLFGGLTRAALSRLQAANGIAPAVGYFGAITRTFINNALSAQ